MAKVISFEYSSTPFNVNYDIIWSFKFSLTGDTLARQGGFTTFLRKSDNSTLSGGAGYKALGYLPGESSLVDQNLLTENSDELLTENSVEILTEQLEYIDSADGILDAYIGVGFDTNGYFALSTLDYNGLDSSTPNSLTIRGGSPLYNLIYTAPLSSLSTEFTLLTTSANYCWLRFRLGDISSRIYIDYRYNDGAQYLPLTSIPLDLTFTDSTRVYVGISYATPLTSSETIDTTLLLKSFTVEGNTITTATSTTYTNLTSIGETILIAQSGGNVATEDEHIVLT